MARPDRYPELYQPALWHDDAHLNEAGAALLTRLLAQEIEKWFAAQAPISDWGS